MFFLHFTSLEAATSIKDGMWLGPSRTIAGAVYAAPVGGLSVPSVQHDSSGCREAAVLFSCDKAPYVEFVEESIWHTEGLRLRSARILPASEADLMLDGSRLDLIP